MAKSDVLGGLPESALFDAPGVRKRRHELHADRVIRTLRDGGQLEARHELACSSIRAAARAVDAAERVVESAPSAYAAIALAQTTRALVDVLGTYGLGIGAADDDDAFRRLLTDLDDDGATRHPTQP